MAKQALQNVIVPDDAQAEERKKPLTRVQRLEQIRHLQTLRWGYLSSYLVSLGWFFAEYFKDASNLSKSELGPLVLSVGLFILGFFFSLRIKQFTRLINRDMEMVGTTIGNKGWQEWVFSLLAGFGVLLFGLNEYFGWITI